VSHGHGAPRRKTRRRGLPGGENGNAGLLIGAIVTMGAGCATNGAVPPPGSPTTLMSGWEHHFSIDWTAVEQTGNTRRVSGYVSNHNGEFATHLRVLAQALDPAGAVVGQRIAYVPGGVGGFGRAYFIVPSLPIADSYRVSVWDYTWNQAPGSRAALTARPARQRPLEKDQALPEFRLGPHGRFKPPRQSIPREFDAERLTL